jgi:putative transposase
MGRLTARDVDELVHRLRITRPSKRPSVYGLARIYGVTPRWVRAIRQRDREGQPLPGRRPRGRPREPRPEEEADLVLAAERQHRLHPQALERLLATEYGLSVPHNRAWRLLKEVGLVVDSPKKQRRRKWVRFERRHSNSLWQMDYTLLGPGDWLLAILDDASRLVVGWIRTKGPTAEAAWTAFQTAGERWGYPRQILSDNGSHFTAWPQGGEGHFDRQLRALNRRRRSRIQHIHSRVHHPQTGGKIERLFGTLKPKLRAKWPDGEPLFDSLEELVAWYNEDKPHLSLDFEHAETPLHAFVRKLRPKERATLLVRRPELREVTR